MRLLLALALTFAPSLAMAQADSPPGIPYTDTQAKAAAPVQTVNTAIGNVTVPTRIVARGTIIPSTSTGLGSLAFISSDMGISFPSGTIPTCYFTVQSTNTNYVFAELIQSSVDNTQVSISTQAALKILSISLGALTVWGPPPAGTTINVTCSASAP